jgi:hypothetical protein
MERVLRYLKGTKRLGLRQPLNSADIELNIQQLNNTATQPDYGWKFYSDSDFAGNSEVQNKRRSQNGWICMLGDAVITYGSNVSGVAFANADIGESHADISSGAAEIYAAANATYEMLQLSYIADELGIPFPKPMLLQVDNTTAEIFANDTAFRSRLKHIDARQEWVKTLRDHDLVKVIHVSTNDNLADIMTKILPVATFIRLRNLMMFEVPSQGHRK